MNLIINCETACRITSSTDITHADLWWILLVCITMTATIFIPIFLYSRKADRKWNEYYQRKRGGRQTYIDQY